MKKTIYNLDYAIEFAKLVDWINQANYQSAYDYPDAYPNFVPPVRIINIREDNCQNQFCDLECDTEKDFDDFFNTLPFALSSMIGDMNERYIIGNQNRCKLCHYRLELKELKNE